MAQTGRIKKVTNSNVCPDNLNAQVYTYISYDMYDMGSVVTATACSAAEHSDGHASVHMCSWQGVARQAGRQIVSQAGRQACRWAGRQVGRHPANQ